MPDREDQTFVIIAGAQVGLRFAEVKGAAAGYLVWSLKREYLAFVNAAGLKAIVAAHIVDAAR